MYWKHAGSIDKVLLALLVIWFFIDLALCSTPQGWGLATHLSLWVLPLILLLIHAFATELLYETSLPWFLFSLAVFVALDAYHFWRLMEMMANA